eukprot:1159509-Pelagomonas_calceolata.AAC.13
MQLGVLLTILLKAKGGKSKPSSEGLSDADLGNSSSDGSDGESVDNHLGPGGWGGCCGLVDAGRHGCCWWCSVVEDDTGDTQVRVTPVVQHGLEGLRLMVWHGVDGWVGVMLMVRGLQHTTKGLVLLEIKCLMRALFQSFGGAPGCLFAMMASQKLQGETASSIKVPQMLLCHTC